MPTVLVTGCAGFIGFHVCRRLGAAGFNVVGVDNFNSYYPPVLKHARADILRQELCEKIAIDNIDLATQPGPFRSIVEVTRPQYIIHLAAVAGVQYSTRCPRRYIQSNIVGFQTVIDAAREFNVLNFVYASSSSVYGHNGEFPSHESLPVDSPASVYAATKVCNEMIAGVYDQLYDLPSVGLRFFTVYGPWSRPDMALWLFVQAIRHDEPITLFGQGEQSRDWTFIDDIVEGIIKALAFPKGGSEVFNLGAGHPVNLLSAVHRLEDRLGKKATIVMKDMQPGDVRYTHASILTARNYLGYEPHVPINYGIDRFVTWVEKNSDLVDKVDAEMPNCWSYRSPLEEPIKKVVFPTEEL